MRAFLLILTLFCGINLTYAQQISFEQTQVDLGQIKYKDGNKDFEYKFTNTGTSPLVLLSVDTSCDCTDIEYPKQPIMPNQSAAIKISYKPQKNTETFYKTVQVYTNSPSKRDVLTFKGSSKN